MKLTDMLTRAADALEQPNDDVRRQQCGAVAALLRQRATQAAPAPPDQPAVSVPLIELLRLLAVLEGAREG